VLVDGSNVKVTRRSFPDLHRISVSPATRQACLQHGITPTSAAPACRKLG
jgi:hypothetical protein